MKSSYPSVAASCNFVFSPAPACTPLAGIDYYGETRPVSETPWDFFEFLPLDRQNLVCSIGEANGSGIAARFTMASLQAFLRALTRHHRDGITAIIRDLNRAICEISPDGFYASLFYAWVDRARGLLHYVSAGHAPVLLVRRDGARVYRLENSGTVLGLSLRVGFHHRTVEIENGDLLIAASDGVTDCLAESEILRMALRRPRPRPADLVREILDTVRTRVDRTVLAMRFQDVGEARHAESAVAAELAFSAA
jgi:serine phosphatase RsbU (regulator of sigma subunit)